jgi:hypothetical protein
MWLSPSRFQALIAAIRDCEFAEETFKLTEWEEAFISIIAETEKFTL